MPLGLALATPAGPRRSQAVGRRKAESAGTEPHVMATRVVHVPQAEEAAVGTKPHAAASWEGDDPAEGNHAPTSNAGPIEGPCRSQAVGSTTGTRRR